jgi:hypothetical protein
MIENRVGNRQRLGIALGLWLLLIYPTASFYVHLFWLVKLPIFSWIFPLSLLSAFLLAASTLKQSHTFLKDTVWLLLLGFAVSLCIRWVCLIGFDFSWDGLGYHQHAVLALVDGLNPLYNRAGVECGLNALWINAYPKGIWAGAASIVSTTNQIELGRMYQWYAFAGTLLLVYAVLRQYFCLPSVVSVLGTAAIMANPLVIIQLHTFYVDSSLLLYSISVACLLLLGRGSGHIGYAISCGLFLGYLPLIKFTGLWFGLCLILLSLIVVRTLAFCIRFVLPTLTIAFCSFVLGSSSSYFPNIITHANPVHPIGSIDLVNWQAPKDFLEMHPIAQWWSSIRSRSSQAGSESVSSRKNPWSKPLQEEWGAYRYAYVQTGGWGPLFYAGFCATAVWALVLCIYKPRAAYLLAIYTVFLLLSAWIIQGSWMSRYLPFTYYWPIVVPLLSCFYFHSVFGIRVLSVFAFAAWVLQGFIIGAVNTVAWQEDSSNLSAQLNRISSSKKGRELPYTFIQKNFHGKASQERRLVEAGARPVFTANLEQPFSEVLIGSKGSVYLQSEGLTKATMHDFVHWLSTRPLQLADTAWYSDSVGNKSAWFDAFQGTMREVEHGWHYYTMLPLWQEYKATKGLY